MLLLIACTNIAALLLARAAERQPQFAVRLALGASKASVVRQMLTETAILAVGRSRSRPARRQRLYVRLSCARAELSAARRHRAQRHDLVFTATLVVAVTLLCGLAPAIQNARETSARTVLEADRSQISRRHSLHWTFVGVQVALSVALLAGAGLLLRSFQELSRVDTGFDPTNVLTFRITGSFAESLPTRIQSVERMLEELAALPGVEGTAASSPVPGVLDDGSGFQFGATEWELADGGDRRCNSGRPSYASSRRRTSRRWQFRCSSARRAAGQRATAFRRLSSIKRSHPDTWPAARPSGC